MEQPCLYYTTEKNEFALAHYMKVFICIGTMRVPEGDLHCQCKLSIFSLSSFGPCIVFWILQKGTCIGKCIFSIFPAVTHQLKCKQTCIEKCRPRHKISMKKWLKILQISKNVNLFPYITTNLHCTVSGRSPIKGVRPSSYATGVPNS